MKKALCIVGVFLTTVVVTATLAACSSIPDGYTRDGDFISNVNPVSLAIVMGRHANAMAVPDDAYRAIDRHMERSVYGGYVCIIISDGAPTKTELGEIGFFDENARNVTVQNNR